VLQRFTSVDFGSNFWRFFLPITAFSVIFLILPFVFFNNLHSWDAAGHYFSVYFTKAYLFPDFSGWNPFAFAGFAQNYFYPPLFYYLAAVLSFILPVDLSIKFLLSISILLLPVSFYYFSKKFGFTDFKASMFMVFFYGFLFIPDRFFAQGSLGGTFGSTFNVGLFPNAFMIPIFFFALGSLKDQLEKGGFFKSSFLIALASLIHFTGFILFVLGIGLVAHNFTKEKFVRVVKIFFSAVALMLFWLVPFVMFSQEYFSVTIFPGLNNYFLVLVIIVIAAVSLNASRKKIGEIEYLFFSLCGLFYGAIFFTVQFHLFRIFFVFFAVSFLLIFKAIQDERIIKGLAVAGILFIFLFANNLSVFGIGDVSFDAEKVPSFNAGRIVVLPDSNYLNHYHSVGYALSENFGTFNSKSLFVESSLNSKFASDIDLGLYSGAFAWGDYFEDHFYYDLLPGEKKALLLEQLKFFAANYIVSDANISEFNFADVKSGSREIILNNKISDYLYWLSGSVPKTVSDIYLYSVGDASYFSPVSEPVVFLPKDNYWRSATVFWFFSLLDSKNILVASAVPLHWNLAKGSEEITLLNFSPNFSMFSIDVDSAAEIPVLVKVSYFPNWHAYSNEKEIPVYTASPNLMAVYAKGRVDFVFERSNLEIIAILMSLLFFIYAIYGGFYPWMKKRF